MTGKLESWKVEEKQKLFCKSGWKKESIPGTFI